jgi:GTP cyclohydrolase IB
MIDLQSTTGESRFRLKSVGVKSLNYPITVLDKSSSEVQSTVARWEMGVPVSAEDRGTHMSRFVQSLQARADEPMSLDDMYAYAQHVEELLVADGAQISAAFTWFREVSAPASGLKSKLGCEVKFSANVGEENEKILEITATAKALCPCSKAISDYGAHNQRSFITVKLHLEPTASVPAINKIVSLMEESASSAIYPLLKREDEKFVTEAAYENPVFAEDLVRNVAEKLFDIPGLAKYNAKVVNQESIHDHDCYAEVEVIPEV